MVKPVASRVPRANSVPCLALSSADCNSGPKALQTATNCGQLTALKFIYLTYAILDILYDADAIFARDYFESNLFVCLFLKCK